MNVIRKGSLLLLLGLLVIASSADITFAGDVNSSPNSNSYLIVPSGSGFQITPVNPSTGTASAGTTTSSPSATSFQIAPYDPFYGQPGPTSINIPISKLLGGGGVPIKEYLAEEEYKKMRDQGYTNVCQVPYYSRSDYPNANFSMCPGPTPAETAAYEERIRGAYIGYMRTMYNDPNWLPPHDVLKQQMDQEAGKQQQSLADFMKQISDQAQRSFHQTAEQQFGGNNAGVSIQSLMNAGGNQPGVTTYTIIGDAPPTINTFTNLGGSPLSQVVNNLPGSIPVVTTSITYPTANPNPSVASLLGQTPGFTPTTVPAYPAAPTPAGLKGEPVNVGSGNTAIASAPPPWGTYSPMVFNYMYTLLSNNALKMLNGQMNMGQAIEDIVQFIAKNGSALEKSYMNAHWDETSEWLYQQMNRQLAYQQQLRAGAGAAATGLASGTILGNVGAVIVNPCLYVSDMMALGSVCNARNPAFNP